MSWTVNTDPDGSSRSKRESSYHQEGIYYRNMDLLSLLRSIMDKSEAMCFDHPKSPEIGRTRTRRRGSSYGSFRKWCRASFNLNFLLIGAERFVSPLSPNWAWNMVSPRPSGSLITTPTTSITELSQKVNQMSSWYLCRSSVQMLSEDATRNSFQRTLHMV